MFFNLYKHFVLVLSSLAGVRKRFFFYKDINLFRTFFSPASRLIIRIRETNFRSFSFSKPFLVGFFFYFQALMFEPVWTSRNFPSKARGSIDLCWRSITRCSPRPPRRRGTGRDIASSVSGIDGVFPRNVRGTVCSALSARRRVGGLLSIFPFDGARASCSVFGAACACANWRRKLDAAVKKTARSPCSSRPPATVNFGHSVRYCPVADPESSVPAGTAWRILEFYLS